MTRGRQPEQQQDSVRIQFGDQIVEVANDTTPGQERDSVSRGRQVDNTEIKEQLHEQYDASWIHLVMQKGRLFNMEYPVVPVLYDRGRFQLVAIDPDEARKLYDSDVCFTIRPLKIKTLHLSSYQVLRGCRGSLIRKKNLLTLSMVIILCRYLND